MLWSNDDTEWTVEEIEIDEPKGRELLVRNVASGLCHSDEHFITGDFPLVNTPYIGGHEGSGVVEAVGPDVQGFEVGDHVVYSFVAACGICPFCADGHSNLCDNGAAIMGGLMLDGTSRIHVKGQDASVMAGLGTFAALERDDEDVVVDVDRQVHEPGPGARRDEPDGPQDGHVFADEGVVGRAHRPTHERLHVNHNLGPRGIGDAVHALDLPDRRGVQLFLDRFAPSREHVREVEVVVLLAHAASVASSAST